MSKMLRIILRLGRAALYLPWVLGLKQYAHLYAKCLSFKGLYHR